MRTPWVHLFSRLCGVLSLGLATFSAQAWPAASMREGLGLLAGENAGLAILVHGTHRDCQPDPGGGLGSRHLHTPLFDHEGRPRGYRTQPCDQIYPGARGVSPEPRQNTGFPRGTPRNFDQCARQRACPAGQRTFCVRELSPGCCAAWRNCEAVIR
jgi:hypothetical protein